MNEKELKELEGLAKAAMEHNPQESDGMLERAVLERKDEMWQIIQKKARRRVRIRKARPWVAAAAVVVMAVLISGAIGINQARAGKDGLLVDIMEGVAGGLAFSNEPPEFLPVTLEDGTWDDIMDNIDPVMIPLLPEDLPEEYIFESGAVEQPSLSDISMSLKYINNNSNNKIRIHYIFMGNNSEVGIEAYEYRQWGKTDVHVIMGDETVNIAWQEQNGCVVEVLGLESEEEGRIFFDAIKKEP